jgi:hypothetical protein
MWCPEGDAHSHEPWVVGRWVQICECHCGTTMFGSPAKHPSADDVRDLYSIFLCDSAVPPAEEVATAATGGGAVAASAVAGDSSATGGGAVAASAVAGDSSATGGGAVATQDEVPYSSSSDDDE